MTAPTPDAALPNASHAARPDASRDLLLAALGTAAGETMLGDAWHGPAMLEAAARFDAAGASARPIPGAHTAWELLLHVAAWTREVARRLDGSVAALPAPGDFPPVPTGAGATGEAWTAAQDDARQAVAELLAQVAACEPTLVGRLHAPVPRPDDGTADGATADDALGVRHSYLGMLVGVAAHHAYHAGQLVLLHRALAAPHPTLPGA